MLLRKCTEKITKSSKKIKLAGMLQDARRPTKSTDVYVGSNHDVVRLRLVQNKLLFLKFKFSFFLKSNFYKNIFQNISEHYLDTIFVKANRMLFYFS